MLILPRPDNDWPPLVGAFFQRYHMDFERKQKAEFVLKVAKQVRQKVRDHLNKAVEAEDWLTVKKIADLLLRAKQEKV